MRALLLTPWMSPHKVISWQTAVTLVYLDKARVLEEYSEDICSPSTKIKMPAVVQLVKPLASMKRAVKFSRINVFMRDHFTCMYCGERKPMNDLNYDHVIPRSRGGKTVWENIVTACYGCNDKKGDKTPREAGMPLRGNPFRPKSLPMSFLQLDRQSIPDLWLPYCQPHGRVEQDSAGGVFLLTGT